ncbi:MAG: translocation/assembly module TamB domain-containing protein, partial [Muribaculum sp.]|nr:translocation/assembly module TamB domain-containing protein [Muribaculum sp.]
MLRRVLKTLMWVVVVVLALPLLLYVPFIQDAVFPFALRKVSGMTGMEITADRLRLQWPLRVTASGVMIVASPGDTMVVARDARVEVEPLPLLGLDIRAEGDLDGIRYRLGTPDSAMYLQAVVDRFRLLPSGYNLRNGHISISRAELDGADVLLLFNGPDTTATPPDTAAATALTIDASLLSLRNVRYRMAMLPVIDSLDVTVPVATLADGHLDMLSRTINARSLSIDSVSATYLTPSAEYIAAHPADSTIVDSDSASASDSLMWTITGDSLRLTAHDALYAMRGAVPAPGLDMNYIAVSDVDLRVDSLYNRGAAITVPLRRLSATERCGLKLDASGTFAMDSTAMRASGFSLSTIYSSLGFDAMMGMGDLASDPSLPLSLRAKAAIGLPDLAMAFPAMRAMLDALPQSRDIELEADMDGTVGRLSVDRLSAAMRDYFIVEASGHVADAMNPDNLSGHVDIDGSLPNVQFARNIALTPALAKEVNIPPLSLDGSVDMKRGVISGDLAATVDRTGDMLLKAMWNGRATDYDVALSLDRFPVASIMPSLGIGDVTASLSAEGHGLDITSTRTRLKADADVTSVVFNKKTYTDLKAWASLADGEVKGGLLSLNHDAAFDLDLSGTVAGGVYDVDFEGDVHNLDLKALGMTPDECRGTFGLDGTARIVPDSAIYDATMSVSGLSWTMPGLDLYTPAIDLLLKADDSTTVMSLTNMDLKADVAARCGLDSLIARLSDAATLASSMMTSRRIAVDTLQRALPPFRLDVSAGAGENLLTNVLKSSDTDIRNLSLAMANDSIITLSAAATGISAGSTRIDTVSLSAMQHGEFLIYRAAMNNRPGTFDDFAHVDLSGYIGYNGLSAFFDQKNIQGKTGFKLGATVSQTDTTMTLRLTPLNPVIGYKDWTLNNDNFITFNFPQKHLDADLRLSGASGSHLNIFTRHDSLASGHEQEKVILSASGIELADWLSLSPFAPPVKGVAGADIAIDWDAASRSLTGQGNVSLDSLSYGGEPVGSFLFDVGVTTNTAGVIHASTSLMIDSVKVITAVGALNDSTRLNPFDLDFSMIHLPLRIVNPFLPPDMASIRGTLNGTMSITGTLTEPVFDGYLDFDSTAVMVDMIGTEFTFSEEKIPVDSNVVRFDHYAIKGKNDNPLYVDGTVDMRSLTSPAIDLTLNARNMQAIASQRSSGSDVYGKAFVDVDARVRGNLDIMRVNTTLTLLPGSNVTYVMGIAGNDMSALGPTDDDMVRFVQFSDT